MVLEAILNLILGFGIASGFISILCGVAYIAYAREENKKKAERRAEVLEWFFGTREK